MAIFARIRTGDDIVNGLVTVRPRDDGTIDSSDGTFPSGAHPRAQHDPSGATNLQWTALESRYKVDPTGWST